MNRRLVVLVGVSLFAITLAIVIGSRLTGEALLMALGIAVGVALGIPVGAMAMWVGHRSEQMMARVRGGEDGSTLLALSDQQADRLFKALDRPQASADAFTLPTRQERHFSAVGGADLTDAGEETP